MPTLRKGDAGPEVAALQKGLSEAGHGRIAGRKLAPDGRFGPDTDRALRQFQRARGLIPDGIAGPKTWAAQFLIPENTRPPVQLPRQPARRAGSASGATGTNRAGNSGWRFRPRASQNIRKGHRLHLHS